MKISWNLVPKDPINNKSRLIEHMTWHQLSDKPLSEPVIAQFIGMYMSHLALMS